MYSISPSFVLGFHGCERDVGERVLAGEQTLLDSTNDYDWLGRGAYFWENNPQRALSFATNAQNAVLSKIRSLSALLSIWAVAWISRLRVRCVKSARPTCGLRLPQKKRVVSPSRKTDPTCVAWIVRSLMPCMPSANLPMRLHTIQFAHHFGRGNDFIQARILCMKRMFNWQSVM